MVDDLAHAPLILVVEDERELGRLLEHELRREGYRTARAATGHQALERVRSHHPALVLLDVNLPDLDGAEVCRRIKAAAETAHVRVMMLTGLVTEKDRVAGFEAGADDYVCKPFSLRELLLRVEAVGRRERPRAHGVSSVRRTGALEIDPAAFLVRVDGAAVPVTKTEFQLLLALSDEAGRVYSCGELAQAVWHAGADEAGSDARKPQTHIRRLRSKLGHAGAYIETVRAVGYRLRVPG